MKKRILIIDDDHFLSELYQELLKDEGYEIDTAFDGETGLKKILTHQYDFVYLDIVLPKIDGIQIFEKFKTSGKKQGKIVAFTNLNNTELVEKLFSMGIDGYELLTNSTPDQLLKRIKRYISGDLNPSQSQKDVLRIIAEEEKMKIARRSEGQSKRNLNILIVEDDLEAISFLMKELYKLEENLYWNEVPVNVNVTVVGKVSDVLNFINKQSTDSYAVILLDRDCKSGGSFHSLDIKKFGTDKIISISSIPEYNDEARKMGIKNIVEKDFTNLAKFSKEVVNIVKRIKEK